MNAHRPTETEVDRENVKATARSLYKEAFSYAVAIFHDKKAKHATRLAAAALIIAEARRDEPA